MSELFNDLKPKEKKIPNNIQVNQSMFSDLMPSEDKHQYKITEKGNPGNNLTNEDKLAVKKLSNTEFDKKFTNTVTGLFTVPKIYKEGYEALSDEEKKKETLRSYSQDRYFKERWLPEQGYSYTTPVPQDIVDASTLINYYNSIGDDTTVTEIKKRLKEKGYDLTDYNL